MKTPRFALADWLDLGLQALAAEGPAGLTIDALTARAAKTRGSFYAHFPSMADFRLALGRHWHETFTARLKRDADTGASPLERLALIDDLAMRLDMRVEQGMRRLAGIDEPTAGLVAAVDRERIAYLAELYEAAGFAPAKALALARFEYAAFVGFQQVVVEPGEAQASYRIFLEAVRRS